MSAKDFLYGWLGKTKQVAPAYNVQALNRGGVGRFKCEVRVPGYSYIAMGNSTNKKDACTNAAMDFCNYLVRQGELKQEELPSLSAQSLESTIEVDSNGNAANWPPQQGSFFKPKAPNEPIQAPAPQNFQNNLTSRDQYVSQRAEEVAQSESVDLKAEIHGGWTVDNSKSALNEFLQKTKQPAAAYRTERKETNGYGGFTATLSIFLPQTGQTMNAQGAGSTKKVAESNCAMSLVRQLFHMKILVEFQGGRRRTRASNLPEIPVQVPDPLTTRVKEYVQRQGVVPVVPQPETATPDLPQSLVVDHRLAHFPDSEISPPCNVSWSPPMQNWNPWRSCNIDEPPLAFMSVPEISQRITQKETEKRVNERIQNTRRDLPVAQFRDQIIETVAGNQVTLIKGETGCGKSTQVAQFLLEDYLEAGKGAEFNAFVSQPRRISAISLAERVAAERCEDLGESVGYGVRFDTVCPRPYGSIFFCTVGVLLRKMESGLRGVSHVIIDEIHERDLDTDFVVIVLREMIREFPDLRLVLMSATIDTRLFTEYFGGCPVIEMHGRTHPVQKFFLDQIIPFLNYMPPEPLKNKDDDEGEEEIDEKNRNLNILNGNVDPMLRQAMARINENDIPYDLIEKILLDIADKGEDGAVLIFLPGWQEIMTLLNQLTNHPVFSNPSQFVVLPLHSQLTAAEQRRVFDHFGQGIRKIILSTNIAETSVTIDDVVYVIDSCKSRERLYSTNNNMVHYATVWASRSNMAQRCGRAGRVRPGFAFQLCSQARFEALDEHRTAEILRTPLYAVALTIKLLRLGSVGDFLAKAIEPPPCDMVVESEAVLKNMGALDRNLELTDLGRILARLPIEPVIGKTIVLAASLGIGSLMCELAAASSFSSPFVPRERTHTRLSGGQRSFAGNRWSDHVAVICVNQAFAEASEQGGYQSEQSFCQRYSLSMPVLKTTSGARRQLFDTLTSQCGFPMEAMAPIYADAHGNDSNLDLLTSLLVAAYYPNISFYKGKRQVYTLEQAKALISKMSILTPMKGDVVNLPSPLIVFTKKVRTRVISCKELTVVNAVQLILFGCRKVECVGADQVRLDDMITLKMDVELAAALMALRPCIERHLIVTCTNPESLMTQSDEDRELVSLLRDLSSTSIFAEAGAKDYLLTDEALQGMQPVNNTRGRRRGGYRGSWGGGGFRGQRGFGFGQPRGGGYERSFGERNVPSEGGFGAPLGGGEFEPPRGAPGGDFGGASGGFGSAGGAAGGDFGTPGGGGASGSGFGAFGGSGGFGSAGGTPGGGFGGASGGGGDFGARGGGFSQSPGPSRGFGFRQQAAARGGFSASARGGGFGQGDGWNRSGGAAYGQSAGGGPPGYSQSGGISTPYGQSGGGSTPYGQPGGSSAPCGQPGGTSAPYGQPGGGGKWPSPPKNDWHSRGAPYQNRGGRGGARGGRGFRGGWF